jgi:hypothetical protein
MNNVSTHNLNTPILQYTSPNGLGRRRSLEPICQSAISTPNRRSSSLPPLEGSGVRYPDVSHPAPLRITIGPANTYFKIIQPESRKARAASLPLDSRHDADPVIQSPKGRPVRSNSTSSRFHPTGFTHGKPAQKPESIGNIRTASLLQRLDKDDQATEIMTRSDSMGDNINKTTGRENLTERQTRPGDVLQEIHQKEVVRSSPEKTEFVHCGSAESTPPSDHHAEENPPVSSTLSPANQSLSPSLVTEMILPIGAEISQPTSPPRPILHPVSPRLTMDPVIPPLALPPTMQALEPAITSSQGPATEGEDSMRCAVSNETTVVEGRNLEVDKVVLGPGEVKGTSMEMNATKAMTDLGEKGDPQTLSEGGQGDSARVVRSTGGEEINGQSIRIYDNTEEVAISPAKASLHLGSAQAADSNVETGSESGSNSDRRRVSERVASPEGRQLRSTSLPPMKGDSHLDARVRRSNSLAKEFKPVFNQPLVFQNETPLRSRMNESITAENPLSQRDTDRQLSDNMSYRPRPRGRSKKRKPLDRSTSQSYISQPEAKRIRLRSTSMDSADSQLSLQDFRGIVRCDAKDDNLEKARQVTTPTPPREHISSFGNGHMVEEEMDSEEAQAALTVAKRGLTLGAAIKSLKYPETPFTDRTLGLSVELVSCTRKYSATAGADYRCQMSSYPSTPDLTTETPRDMHSSPPCQTPTSGDRLKKRKAEVSVVNCKAFIVYRLTKQGDF